MSTDATDELMLNGEDKMDKVISRIKKEFTNIRTGRANPSILDKLTVEYYGSTTELRQVSNVSVQEGTTLVIQPFDKSLISEIEKAIQKSDLGITPNNDGVNIRIKFPPLTEDRGKDLVKTVKKLAEEGKVAIRNVRRDVTDALKKLEKSDSLPEDLVKGLQDDVQKMTDKYIKDLDNLSAEKEKEVLTV